MGEEGHYRRSGVNGQRLDCVQIKHGKGRKIE